MDSNWPTVAFRTAENLPIDLARQIFGDADILELHNVGQMEKGQSRETHAVKVRGQAVDKLKGRRLSGLDDDQPAMQTGQVWIHCPVAADPFHCTALTPFRPRGDGWDHRKISCLRQDDGRPFSLWFVRNIAVKPTSNVQGGDSADAYVQAVPASCSVPILSTEICQADVVNGILEEHPDACWIVSSKRAARVLADAAQRLSRTPAVVYAVGLSSARVLGISTKVNSRNASELVSVVESDWNAGRITTGTLFFLSGDKRLDTIPSGLRLAEIPFQEICVYETRLNHGGVSRLLGLVRDAAESRRLILLVVFSPSGADHVLDSLCLNGPVGWKEFTRFAAIGKTTAAALGARGIAVVAEAETPDATAMAAAINSWECILE
ncbi:MAG: hypothetical protein SGCHY_001120 [Lobulomycetales sp.]